MPYSNKLGNIPPGTYFYFPYDPDYTIYKKLDDQRKPSSNQVFIYCEDPTGNVDDFSDGRQVIAFRESEKKKVQPPEVEKLPPVMIAYKSPSVYKAKQQWQPPSTFTSLLQNIQASTPGTMTHTPAGIVSIFKTTDYNLFSTISGNRSINSAKIKRIIKEIDNGNDMLQYYPINVQEEENGLAILDGQHRFTISKILKRPVYYILVPEQKSMSQIAKVNSKVEKWKALDYINCYIKAGNSHYVELYAFWMKYKFSVGLCLSLLNTSKPGEINGGAANLTRAFEQGNFEVNFLEEATLFAELCKRFEAFPNWKSRNFVYAIYKIKIAEKYPFEDIARPLLSNIGMLTEQAHFKEYIYKIEQIINAGKKNRMVIV